MTTSPASCAAGRHDAATYSSGACRCPVGREAHRLYRKRLREGRQPSAFIPGAGTGRRLQSLVAIGYCWKYLAGRLGITSPRVRYWAQHPESRVGRETGRRVKALFDELSDIPGPSKYARTVAARRGFVPPAAWDDSAIDDPNAKPWTPDPNTTDRIVDLGAVGMALKGRRLPLTRAERHHAIHVGIESGMTRQAIATALHMSYDLVKTLANKPVPDGYELAA